MQNIIIEKPYRFIPPRRGNLWPTIIERLRVVDWYLRRFHGVESYECRHADRLAASIAAGHGVLLTPNHCRPADPIVMAFLGREVGSHAYTMASWHLFHQGWFTPWAIRLMGGFSINREGVDRQAIQAAVEILESGERPLIIFPEGVITRTNDRLHAMLDGVSFIARAAAKKRRKEGGRVVVHPVAIKYRFQGNLARAVAPVLNEIEHRLWWRRHDDRPLLERIAKIGMALLSLKELDYFGQARQGTLTERLAQLIDRLLGPLEEEWLGCRQGGPVVPRIKNLRLKIVPEMVRNELSGKERARRWDQLADIYLAQQVSCYLPDYLDAEPTVDRLLETVERYEEDLTDKVRVHGSLRAILQVGEAIDVSADRDRAAAVDPLMARIERGLQDMLDALAHESPKWREQPAAGSGSRREEE